MNQKQTQNPAPNPACRKRAYRIPQACEAYGFKRSMLYDLMAQGKLRYSQVNGIRLITEDALDELLASNEKSHRENGETQQ